MFCNQIIPMVAHINKRGAGMRKNDEQCTITITKDTISGGYERDAIGARS